MSASQRPSVFISHKANDLDTEPVLREILASLNGDFDIQIDVTGLEPGQEWQEKIEKWLHECHAAILLLSPAAIKSHWVQFETNFLCLRRRAVDRDLAVLAVPLGDVLMHELPCEFNKSRISEIQAISGPNTRALTDALRNALRPVKEKYGMRPSLYELERDLIDVFEQIGDNIRSEVVLDAAECLGLDRTALAGIREKSRWLASKLFAIDLDKLDALIRVLPAGIRQKCGAMIVQNVAPFCWIDAKAAARIPEVARQPESQRGAGINSEHVLTARMYIRRACVRSKIWPYREVPATWSAEEAANDLISYVRKLVINMMGYPADDEVTPEELRAALLDEVKKNGPVIVIIPREVCKADPSLLAELMAVEEFKPLTFLVLLGNITAQQFDDDRITRIEYIRPELDRQEEREALRKIRKIDPRVENYEL